MEGEQAAPGDEGGADQNLLIIAYLVKSVYL